MFHHYHQSPIHRLHHLHHWPLHRHIPPHLYLDLQRVLQVLIQKHHHHRRSHRLHSFLHQRLPIMIIMKISFILVLLLLVCLKLMIIIVILLPREEKKSIKTKPAPSPPPPLPSLPPLASRPKSVTQGALSPILAAPEINGTDPSSSSEVIVHSPRKSPSSPKRPSHTPRSPSPSASPQYIPTCSNTHHNYRPVTLKCLPCRSHLVPVCPISTLTRSLSDQKQINGKHMLKSVASYSSDLNLPKFTRVSGLITNDNSPTGFNEKRLESDSIIITYDDSDYIYPLMGNCYSSVEIPHSVGNVTNESDLFPDRPTTPMRKKRQKDEPCMNESQSYTILPVKSGLSSPLGRPPRPPSPKMGSNSYRIINRSVPQIPHRNRRRNRPDYFSMSNYCSLDSCCRSDPLENVKIVPKLPSKSSSLAHVRPRSAPSTPCRNVHGSRSLPKTNSTFTLNQDKTLSNSLSGSNNPNCANGLGCSTATCSLCSLNGGQNGQRSLKSPTITLNREPENRKSSLDEPIYEEIDFGVISEDVAALLSPKQLINSANNKRHTWQGKSSTLPGGNDEMLLTACSNAIDPIETIRGEAGRLLCLSGTTTNTRGGGGGSCSGSCSGGQEGGNGHQLNLVGEILSDTSDDRVTVKSMSSHNNNNNQLKPWAYSSSSLDSEQSTTSSGSTVKQRANQLASYPSNGHYHHHHFTNHHVHQHQHHSTNHEHDNLNHLHGGSSRGSSSVTSSTSPSSCYHGNNSAFFRIQGIGQKCFQQNHHHFHHNHHQQQHGVDDDVDGEDEDEEVEKENDQHLHSHQLHGHLPHHHRHHHHPFDPYHPHLASSSATSPGKQYHQCYHCQNHYHPHHHHYRHYYQHHGQQMITTSTSDHSLSSLSSSNFSEDPATPTPLNLMIAPHDDYNLTFLSEDLSSSAGHHCPDLDETNEDELDGEDDDNIDVTVDEDDVEEEEVMIFNEILFRGDAKNEFGKSSCCYSDPFYRILDLHGDEHDDDETRDAQDDDDANTISNEMREEEDTQEDSEKLTRKPEIGSTSSPRLKYIKSGQLPPSTNAAIEVNKKTKSLSSLIYHRFNCDSIVNNQSPCHCHQCYHHHHHHYTQQQHQQHQQQQHPRHHLIGTKAYHQHLINNYQQLNKAANKPGHSGSKDNIIMASSWDGDGHFTGGGDAGGGGGGNNNINSGPFAVDHQAKQNQNQTHHETSNSNSNSNDENNINRLMQELQLAISYGQHRKAALLARQLALRKVSCSFNQSTANGTANDDQPIIVYLYIEDRQSRQGPFPIQLYPSMTVRMLKQKIEGDFGFPVNLQSWILGKCLATNEEALLSTFGITLSGCPIFLYLLSNTIDHQVTINGSQNDEAQSVPASVVASASVVATTTAATTTTLTQSLGEKTQRDDDDDDGDADEMENNKIGGNHGDDQNENQVNTQLILTNDSKEEMKGGKRRSISMAGKLLTSTGENETINGTHAGLNEHLNEKRTDPMVEVKSTLSASSSYSSFKSFTSTLSSLGHFKTNAETNSLETNGNTNESVGDVTTPAVKTLRRHKSAKSMASSSSTSSTTSSTSSSTFQTPSCSPSTSKSSSRSIKTHNETRSNQDNPTSASHEKLHGCDGGSDAISFEQTDRIPIEPTKRQHRKIQSITKPNDIKMMAASNDDNLASTSAPSASDTKRPVNDNAMIQQSTTLITNEQDQGNHDDDYGDDEDDKNNKSSGNQVDISCDKDDNKGNGSNKMAEMIGQQVEGDYNQLELLQAKGQITETYKLLVELDDVDLVKNSQEFECPICFINIPTGEGVVLRDCLHTFCRECLCNAIEFCDEAIVKCPYRGDEYACDSTITDREIKSLACNDLYQKYLARSMKAAELRIEKSFHCKTADCPGWCEFDDNVNTFPCPVCGKVNCLTCQAIHENNNCRQYQDTLSSEAAESNEDAKATKQFLDNMLDKGEALRCPICFVILIKKWGCDWVKCSMCQSEICWVTKGPRWGPGGKGDISGGCKCMINGQKCHPKCNYCH